MARSRWQTWALVGFIVGPSMACQSGTTTFPPGPQVVAVSMREYGYRYNPPAASGRIVFDARNVGRTDHELVLISVGDDIPPIDQQLRSGDRLVVPTVARLASREPGRSGIFAVDLPAGRYAMVCFVKDPDGGQHAQKGMSAEFRIGT